MKNTALFLICISLGACSSLPTLKDIAKISPWYKANKVESISVFVPADPELRYALNIDVAFVYTDAVLAMVNGLNGSDWFVQKPGIKAGYGDQIKIMQWQMVAGYADEGRLLPSDHSDALAVVAFAYYPENPNTKVILNEMEAPWLVFSQGKLSASNNAPLSLMAQKTAQNKKGNKQ